MEYEAAAAAAMAAEHAHPGSASDQPAAALLAHMSHMGYGGHVMGYSSHPGGVGAAQMSHPHQQLMPGVHRIASPNDLQQQAGAGEPPAKVRRVFARPINVPETAGKLRPRGFLLSYKTQMGLLLHCLTCWGW